MTLVKLASFCEGPLGGNPAGVMLTETLSHADDMQRIAAEVGFSETAFACPQGGAWRTRYFSPEAEVPFCGHATVALGAVLAREHGTGIYDLKLNEADITVEGTADGHRLSAALQSPPTRSAPPDPALVANALTLFGLTQDDLDARLPPVWMHAGADHLAITLRRRQALADMAYDLDSGKALMRQHGLVTVMLAFAQTPQHFHSRNPFASSGVYEDPATGAATAAYAGMLRDRGWPHGGELLFNQGADMGQPSTLHATLSDTPGSSVRVYGDVRVLHDDD